MAGEFEIQDEEEQTIALSGGDEGGDAGAAEPEPQEALPPPQYRPDSNVYTAMLVSSCIAYAVGLGVVLAELKDYCDPAKFLFGLWK